MASAHLHAKLRGSSLAGAHFLVGKLLVGEEKAGHHCVRSQHYARHLLHVAFHRLKGAYAQMYPLVDLVVKNSGAIFSTDAAL